MSRFAPVPAEIVRVVDETRNVRTYYVEPRTRLETPRPGQFFEVYVYGAGEIPVSVSDYEGDGTVAFTVRFVGSVTLMFERLREGDTIGIRGPYGNGWPMEELRGRDVLIIAGGIGLPPLRPVIREIERNRARYGRVAILYGARTPRDLVYRYEYPRYEMMPDTQLLITVDRAEGGWRGFVGFVTDLIPRARVDPANCVVLMCGPEIMMRVAVKKLLEHGFREDSIYLSMERRMRCGIGLCGHCQFGPFYVCRHGPVFRYRDIKRYLGVEQI